MERKLDRDRRLADYIYNDLSSEEVVEIDLFPWSGRCSGFHADHQPAQ